MAKVVRHKDANSFLKMSQSFLEQNESINNLVLGLSISLSKSEYEDNGGELFYSIIHQDEVVGCAIRTGEERPFSVTQIKKEFLPVLIKKLRSDEIKLQGVVGFKQTVKDFVSFYGHKVKMNLDQGLYELSQVTFPKNVKGSVREATMEDLEVCTELLRGFLLDCFDDEAAPHAEKMMTRNLKYGKVFLWISEENIPVAMAARIREGIRGAGISLVYTPPEARGRGFASAVVASLSQALLNDGFDICYLHTDLSNPISNSIYQKIGYQKVCEFIHYDFLV
ncbi:GNAT family N-acetyltransferase [Bacteriovorax sp. Seq25_V]|uniref:GNAT family N-acetyltransferase n=1 Tax=Bacteriovorax sp. Seq25_V TaxID=1201288 RepID=UPI00038A3F60|nr:GNAT family N-acetyltransferase [Bacteriovorax sp. Seq25_V]EQC45598.1 FR47-like protein [Bacteriovorax sp. Seq25_V]